MGKVYKPGVLEMMGMLMTTIAATSLSPDQLQQIAHDSIVPYPYIWITSPTNKTTVSLETKLALRIIRKQGWSMVPVEPRRHISRLEALKILVFGD